jgi:hypothetical protein
MKGRVMLKLAILLLLTSCGSQIDKEYKCIIEGNKCSPSTKQGEPGKDGQDGVSVKGDTGASGTNGTNGSDGTNGVNGIDGVDGSDAILEVIDPCGPGSSYDEVILRLNDGRLVALYKKSLIILTPGNYKTSDAQKCKYTVESDLTINW